MKALIKAWKFLIHSAHSYPRTTSLKIPITALHYIMDSISFTYWQWKGWRYVNDLFEINTLKPFATLQKDSLLPNSDLYKSIRMEHCISAISLWPFRIPFLPGYFSLPLLLSVKEFNFSILVSKKKKCAFTKSAPLLRWENYLGCTFTDKQWTTACNTTYKVTSCSTLWELTIKLTIKLTLRWYLTPNRVCRFGKLITDLCWRNCGQNGDLLHTF